MVAVASNDEQIVRLDPATPSPRGDAVTARVSICEDTLLTTFYGRIGGLVSAPDGTLFVSDVTSGTIWHLGMDGSRTTVVVGSPDSAMSSDPIELFAPSGLALGPNGTLFIADSTRHRIIALSPEGVLRVVAGGSNGYRDGPAAQAMFRFPRDVAFSPDGNLYVADTANDRIRAISPDGTVTTVAGSNYDYGDGHGTHARFRRPSALDVDVEGNLYVADTGNNAIRRVRPDGEVTTLAGTPPGGDHDGRGPEVGLRWPSGVAVDVDATVWIADHGNSVVRHLSAAGESTTELRLSGLRWPTAVSLRPNGSLAVAGAALVDAQMSEACVMILGGTS